MLAKFCWAGRIFQPSIQLSEFLLRLTKGCAMSDQAMHVLQPAEHDNDIFIFLKRTIKCYEPHIAVFSLQQFQMTLR